MKRIIAIMLVLVLAFSGAAYAQDTASTTSTTSTTSENNAMTKLGRGVLNILDAVVEIPGTMMRTSDEEGLATGLTKGTVVGVVNTIKRALVGSYEVVTFPIPVPEDYAPILDDPQFLSKE